MASSLFSKRILSLWLLSLSTIGCSFTLDLRGASLVNPEEPLAVEGKNASRELSFRLYQLKQHENLHQVLAIPWEAFGGSEIPEPLKPFLAVAADIPAQLRPQEDYFIRRQQRKRVRLSLAKDAKALLVVTRGRRGGESSLQLIELGVFDRHVSLCFQKYEVFKDPDTWPCARDRTEDEE